MYPNGKGLLQRVYKIPYEYQIASWGGQGTALPEPTTLSLTLFEDSLKVGERIDSSLSSAGLANFDVDFYELKSTFPDLGQDYFAVKWVGSIRGPKTGNVKLNFYTDNGFIVQIGDTIYDKFWLYDWEKN